MDNDLDKAMEAIEQALKYDAQFQDLHKEIVGTAAYEAGKKQLAQKEFPKAVDSFSKSVKADPSYAPAFYGLALSYANQGMYPASAGEYSESGRARSQRRAVQGHSRETEKSSRLKQKVSHRLHRRVGCVALFNARTRRRCVKKLDAP